MKLIPHCLTPRDHLGAFVVWLGLVGSRPLAHPVPYLPKTTLRLYLNTFRGEPAISGFDWHFTPTHSSSQPFATDTGSVLHPEIIGTSTWPWVAHPVSGLIQTTHQAQWRLRFHFLPSCAPGLSPPKWLFPKGARTRVSGFHIVSARFAPCLDSLSLRLRNFYSLTKLPRLTRRLILQKARGHPSLEGLPRLVGLRFQVYFTPLPGFFSPFPHGTGSLSVAKGI